MNNEDNNQGYSKLVKGISFSLVGVLLLISVIGVFVGINDYIKSAKGYEKPVWSFDNSDYKVESTVVTDGNIETVTDVSDIVDKVMPSVVSITETSIVQGYYFGQIYSDEVSGSGSGIIIGENDKELLIITNNHVIEDADSIEVTFVNDKTISATVRGTEPGEDLALLTINKADIDEETYNAIKIAQLGDSHGLRVGDAVVAIGNALGYGQSVTFGYVSAKDREIELSTSYGGITTMKVLQTDAAINPGNSGGALVNMEGELIGINSAKLSSEEVEGMGYAIPISNVSGIIDDLSNKDIVTEEDKGFLGIGGSDVTQEEMDMFGYPAGAKVTEIFEGGGAEKADIKVGDIIIAIDGKEVTGISDLAARVSGYKKGTEVEITLMRAYDGVYKKMKVKVQLTETLATEEPEG